MSVHDETWEKCVYCGGTVKNWQKHGIGICAFNKGEINFNCIPGVHFNVGENSMVNAMKNDEFENYSPPDWDSYFMEHVYLAAKKSKDPRTKIGAVLVKDKNIISTGFNGFPVGVKDLDARYNERETKYKFICHGEHNAILQCARLGVSSNGATLFTQGVPCQHCAIALIQGGVKKIVCHKQWPNLIHIDAWVKSIEISKIMLEEAGVEITWLDKVLGVNGYLDGKVINV